MALALACRKLVEQGAVERNPIRGFAAGISAGIVDDTPMLDLQYSEVVKTAMKTAKPLLLIPGCFLGGAIITLFCDGFARTVFAPTELSISSVTAVFLVPVVIVMMLRRNEDR